MHAEGTADSVRRRLRVVGTFAASQLVYWLLIFPRARRELRRWTGLAQAIPDAELRRLALHKLRTEHLTAEGAAAFAILAALRSRRQVVRLCVAFEVLYDFVDGLAERPVEDVLANNRCLYRALGAALSPTAPLQDYYAFNPLCDDAGYLHSLIETCQRSLAQLVSHCCVLPALQRLAARAEEAQSLHHAGPLAGCDTLAEWARHQRPAGSQLYWWEVAAAAGSPLGVFALVAAASHRRTTAPDAAAVERAYFPWIAALSWLLESLVDLGDDLVTDAPSYVMHYATPPHTAERLGLIARRAAEDACGLPDGGRHALLLAGMASMNLSHPGASHPEAEEAAAAVRDAIGGPVGPLIAVLRLRRGAGRRRPQPSSGARSEAAADR